MNDRLPAQLIAHINVKLALIGSPPVPIEGDKEFTEIVSAMAGQSREKDRLLGHYLCPVDQRIRAFSVRLFAGRAGDEAADTHVRPRPAGPCAHPVAAARPR